MIEVYIPQHKNFPLKASEQLYNKCKESIRDTESFKNVIKHTFFYSFIKNNTLLGCIYFYRKKDELFVNGCATRHHLIDNIVCLKMSLKYFNCDIFAEAMHKESALILLRCGFTRFKDNIFIYKRKKV